MNTAIAQKLKENMQTVIADAEELLKATAGQTGERIEKVRTQVEKSLREARWRLTDAKDAVEKNVRKAAGSVDEQVHEHPYATAGIAAGIGLLIGLLISRR